MDNKYIFTPLNEPIPITEQKWDEHVVPLVSIVNNTYNHEGFIRDALEGFLMQKTTFKVEILVHDDASTDGTAAIVREYEARYPELIKPVYQTENQYSKGIKVTSTFQFPRALGKYIAMCEGDDYWTDPLKLQKQVEFLEANPEYVISYHDCKVIDENGKVVMDSQLPENHKKDASNEELVYCSRWVKTLTICYKNFNFDEPQERNYIFNGDMFLISRLGLNGKGKWMGDTITPGVYRMHQNSIWSSLSDLEKKANHLKSYYWIFQYYKRIGLKKYADGWYQRLIELVFGLNNSENTDESNIYLALYKKNKELELIKKSKAFKVYTALMFPFKRLKSIVSKH
jgi:glycosyltransferase involved in cell wall biosynthesis